MKNMKFDGIYIDQLNPGMRDGVSSDRLALPVHACDAQRRRATGDEPTITVISETYRYSGTKCPVVT